MNEKIVVEIPIQIEQLSDQLVRARPLGPWRLQAVGPSWPKVRDILRRKLEKALPDLLPTELFASVLPALCQKWTIRVELPPVANRSLWKRPVGLELQCFRWLLPNGNSLIRVPAVNCTLFGKHSDLNDDEVEKQAKIAMVRMAENQDLLTVCHRFARRSFDYESVPLSIPVGKPPIPKDADRSEQRKSATLRAAASDLTRVEPRQVFGIDDRVRELSDLLQGESPQSVLIVGPPGIGKTSLVYRLVDLRAQLGLPNRKIWSTSGARIVSGMSGLGMWQQRCSKLIREAHETQAILHLGSLFELMDAGKIDGQPGVGSMVRQSISRGKLLAIAECTPEQLALVERADPLLLRAFGRFEMKELEKSQVISVLQTAARENPNLSTATYTPQALEELYRLHSRFATYSTMPAAPLRLMQTISDDRRPGTTIESQDIARAFAKQTGLPGFLVDDSISLDLKGVEEQLASHVIGQPEPVELIVNLIATLKARMIRPGRPLASLLFIGPTGVGKTEMAKAIARLLYSDPGRMVRIDMSEYSSPWSAVKLIGKSGEGEGALTAPIREQPFSVVLLDEFEKADPTVFDTLLQLLGDGRLTDAKGKLADFRNAVVIMTSNLGADSFRDGNVGFGEASGIGWREHFEREVRRFVRPEFLGRLDRIVPFRPLPKEGVQRIARRELEMLKSRIGLKFSDSTLDFSQQAVELLSELGYQPKYGARPLRRAIEQHVTVPLADALSQNQGDGSWRFDVVAKSGKLEIVSTRVAVRSKSYKEIEADSINAWQELAAMARTARSSPPMRDLENEMERLQRQNVVLERRLKTAHGPRRIASIREQLLQGHASLENGWRLRNRLLESVEEICELHLRMMVAWHGNQSIDWEEYSRHHQQLLVGLRYATESIVHRRLTSSGMGTLLALGRDSARLEILWNVYLQLARESNWTTETFLLQEYDPLRDRNSPEFRKRVSERRGSESLAAANEPELRIPGLSAPGDEGQFRADAFPHGDSKALNEELATICGFAIQFRGLGIENWLDEEAGIVHFFDATASGSKRRSRIKIVVFPSTLAKVQLSHDWLEPIASAERDPHRLVDIARQQVTSSAGTNISFSQGKQADALAQLIREEHERALWEAIGYNGMPESARVRHSELEVPF
jgi:ATP-dependent Clp protease ATP-binding subunit ClpA